MKQFNNHFRGSNEDIANQFAWLVNFLNLNLTPKNRVLDLGGGDGFLLSQLTVPDLEKILVDHNSNYAVNLDSSTRIENISISDFFKSSSNITTGFDAIILSHVIEHFTPIEVFNILSNCVRFLSLNGLVIIVTPNANNLSVSANHFWLDPTHIRPYPSLLIKFLLNFFNLEIIEENYDTPFWDPTNPENHNLDIRILQSMFGNQNYTCVGKKKN